MDLRMRCSVSEYNTHEWIQDSVASCYERCIISIRHGSASSNFEHCRFNDVLEEIVHLMQECIAKFSGELLITLYFKLI